MIRKNLSSAKPIPKYIVDHYTKESGWERTFVDMRHIADIATTCRQLRVMQQRVRSWLPSSGLEEAVLRELDAFYSENANREEVAVYLAHVRYRLMTA